LTQVDLAAVDVAAVPVKAQTSSVPQVSVDRWLSLVSAVERLAAADSIESIIRIVRETARLISGAEGVTFVLRDGDLCHYVEENAVGPLWKGRRFPLTACISGWCMLNARTAVIPDIYVDPRIPHDAYRPTFVKSLVMVPVRAENPLAAIGSYWSTCRDFSEAEVALLEGLGRSTAAAIAAVQARETLRENEERLRLALTAGRLGAWEFDLAAGSFTASAACKAHFGHDAAAPFTYEDFVGAIHPEDRRRQVRALTEAGSTGSDITSAFRIAWPDGSEHWIEMRGRRVADAAIESIRLAGVSADVTERKQAAERIERLQSELAHVGRLAEFGQMGAAIAHELTQPLTAASNYLKAGRRFLDGEKLALDRAIETIGKAEAQFQRASDTIRRIRGFVGKSEPVRSNEAVMPLVTEAAEIAQINPKHRKIELRVALEDGLPQVFIDKVQIQQVLLNLLRNAFEALEGHDAPVVTVGAARDRDSVVLRVEDNGPGLSPEVAARLFQPFITTKSQGMGIGLSICRQIIENQGGKMSAAASSSGGAAFSFTVPVAAN
jgi:PAS domain S-box-containing protein